MELTFQHDPRGESLTLIRRADGAVFTLSSYSRKWRVPHDLSHAVTERELGIPDGIVGAIAAVIHEAVEKRLPTPYADVRESWGVISQEPCPYSDEAIDRATTLLRKLDEQWSASSKPLEFPWPTKLRAADPKSTRARPR
ncbi:hypothetical protein GCM10009804_61140 [Kribbella hippodromi]|uniref:Uncharacterized protein n=1 Tax=Kribbella hippodromi TaxID=434347 RepID=A0ABP4Q4S9_9ACTN